MNEKQNDKKDEFLKDYGIEDEKPWGKQILDLMFKSHYRSME